MNYTEEEIVSLIERFELQKLPKVEWTHEAHLVVAIWYCNKHEFESALSLLRDFIIRHNESVGTANTDTGGYHETITKFWLLIAGRFLTREKRASVVEYCNAFINSKYGKSSYPLEYYSKELLFSVEARHSWIGPDLKKLYH